MVSEGLAGDRILFIAMVVATLGASMYLVFADKHASPEDATRSARRWADSLGMRVTGIVCERGRCTVAPERGEPFIIYCNGEHCSLPEKR
jgi:transposase